MRTKVLTVDDCRATRMIVANALRDHDCSVLEADNGVAGLAIARRDKPDVILLDFSMPVMDGIDVLLKLRSDPDLKAIPVIMLTAETGRQMVINFAKLGIRDYLIKPINPGFLIERVGRLAPLVSKTDAANGAPKSDPPVAAPLAENKPATAPGTQESA